MKKCNKCGDDNPLNEYHKDKNNKDGHKNICKTCRLLVQEEYVKNNPNKIKESYEKYANSEKGKNTIKRVRAEYYKNNTKKCIKLSVKWNTENAEFVKKYNKEYYKIRKIKDKYKIIWRSILTNALKRLDKPKKDHTINLLGYSVIDLKQYIESLFTEGMSWDNYGEWHIDHIKRIIDFDDNTHPSIVNALSNLRPLWATTREINGIIYEGNLNRPKS